VVGDVIVLTKPIGTQIAVNAHQWIDQVIKKDCTMPSSPIVFIVSQSTGAKLSMLLLKKEVQ